MSLPYTLDETQVEFYKDTVNIYRQVRPFVTDANSEIEKPEYDATPVYEGIPCSIQGSHFEAGARYPLGQTANENFFTRDTIFFHYGQDIQGMDLIEIDTVLEDGNDHANRGKFMRVIGDPEPRHRGELQYKSVKVEEIGVPKSISSVAEEEEEP